MKKITTVAISLLIGSFQIPGQEPPRFKASIDMVRLQVSVTDKNRPVIGLKKDDFIVYENGRRQEISVFENEILPVNLTLLIDASSSMLIIKPDGQLAALSLISGLKPNDKIRTVQFNGEVALLQDLTTDHRLASRSINNIRLYGGTAIFDAVYAALALRTDEAGINIAVLLTDGQDTSSKLSPEAVADTVRKADTVIYCIRLGKVRLSDRDENFMATIARETGGQLYQVEDPDDLKKAYAQIAVDIRNQYTIGYASNNAGSESWYRIAVVIPEHPNFKVRHRQSYFKASRN